MRKAIGLIFVLWIGIAALPGCDSCVCPKATHADIIGLQSFIFAKTPTTTINVNEPVRWDIIDHFALNYEIRTYSQRRRAGWGTAAYACDCVPPGSLGSTETLTNLTVKTVFDFDATHPAGSSLTESVVLTGGYRTDKYKEVSLSVADFLAGGPVSYEDMIQFSKLSLLGTPTAKGPFALDITVTLDNGEVYTTRTTQIQLR